jgi:hypothetical protein
MKTVKIALAALMLAALSFESCKKGPNDPFLSLKSRKSRVAGDWKVSAGSGTDVSGSSTTTWTYDGTTYTETQGSSSTNYTLTYTMTFDKAGTFKTVMTNTFTGGSDVQTDEGTWNFTGGVGDAKNKDRIIMMTTSSSDALTIGSSTTTSTSTYTGDNAPVATWYLDELKGKEIIFTWDGTTTSGSTTNSSKGTYTLIPQ